MRTKIQGDRLAAFLIIDGKVYESDCDHQECLHQYLKESGKASLFDGCRTAAQYDEAHGLMINKTYEMKCSHEAYGFDLFDTGKYILLAHDWKTYKANREWMEKYRDENDVLIGYFIIGYEAEIKQECA